MEKLKQVLGYAANSPSILNTQPWVVRINSRGDLTVKADPSRTLPFIDFTGRDLFISMGAFIESIYLAGLALGVHMDISYNSVPFPDFGIANIKTSDANPSNSHLLELILARKTVRNNLDCREFSAADFEMLKAGFSELIYYPFGSAEAADIAGIVESNAYKVLNDTRYIEQTAGWYYFNDSDRPDGLCVTYEEPFHLKSLIRKKKEITLYSPEVKKFIFNKNISLSGEGAGWLIISTKNNTHIDWIVVGRIYYRMALAAFAENISLHPMTPAVSSTEECLVLKKMSSERNPQMLLRAGFMPKELSETIKSYRKRIPLIVSKF